MYEWDVVAVKGLRAVRAEIARRVADGWELAFAYQDNSLGVFLLLFLFFGSAHVLYFRRLKRG
jgi:hypothetical protein